MPVITKWLESVQVFEKRITSVLVRLLARICLLHVQNNSSVIHLNRLYCTKNLYFGLHIVMILMILVQK